MKKTLLRLNEPAHTNAHGQALAHAPADELNCPRRRLLQAACTGLFGGLALGLSGCGGGSEDGALATAAEADARKQALSGVDSGGTGMTDMSFFSAVIDSTAPLVVNGVRFDTDSVGISDGDGLPLTVQDLLPGMTGQIEADRYRAMGQAAVARALVIRVSEQLLGPVAAVDVLSRSFMLLGQRVQLSTRTVFDSALGAGLDSLRNGQVVRVAGQLDSAGQRIVASRVSAVAGARAFVVRGVLRAFDRAAGSASIGALQMALAAPGSAAASGLAADLAVGAVVRARLAVASTAAGATLLSMQVDALRLPDRVQAEIEGRVTHIDSPQRFAVDGVDIELPAAALLQGAEWLVLGARASVQGRSLAGRLLATSAKLEPDEPIELEGTIATAEPAQRSFVLKGITVVWSAATVFEGGTSKLLLSRRRAAVLGRWSADGSHLLALHIHVER